MAGRPRQTIAAVAISSVLALLVAAVAFAGARELRHRDAAGPAPAATATATATVVPTPTPSAVASATDAPPASPFAATGAPARDPSPAGVAAALAPLLAAGALGGSVHAMVADASSGSVLLRRGPATGVPPASTTKLTTAAALLAVVGAQARLTTRAVTGAKAGQVVLVGAGDPTLSAAPADRPTTYAGAARLSDLAGQITAAGSRRVTSIVVDSSLFSGPAEAPGWQPEDVPSAYASAITATVVDGGRPAAGGDQRSAQPDLEAGRALAVRLGVPRAVVTRGRAPASARLLGSVRSPTVLDLVEQMLSNSDNVMVEMLARQVARVEHRPLSFAGAAAAVRQALATVGILIPPTLSDASGVSQRDRLSPAVLVALLRTALFGPHPELAQLVSALPVAGWEGTLAARYQTPAGIDGAGRVRAKTGTLSGVVTLAGIVGDRAGRLLVFAVLADRVPTTGTLAAEQAVDAVAARLADCGCR